MKNKILYIILVVVVVIGFVATCPDKNDHIEAINSEMNEAIKDSMPKADSEDGFSEGLNILGSAFATKLISTFVENSINVKNYFVCSVGVLSYQDKSKTVSIGVLGHVFTTFDSEDLKQTMQDKVE